MKKIHKLKDCWVWDKDISEFVETKVKGYTLNVPCGKSKLGDIRADKDPQEDGIEKVEMTSLPWDDNTFDTVIQDPPWKIGFYQRMKPFFECVRVCKIGGKIIYNAYWIPTSKCVELEELYIRQDGQFTNTSIISIFKKTKDVPKKKS